jgi:hypothetical protein
MKIMAHTAGGYLVEMSGCELERLCGKPAEHVTVSTSCRHERKPHSIGKTFDIAPVIDQVHALNRAAGGAKSGAGYLRALADQLEREIPVWIREPQPVSENAVSAKDAGVKVIEVQP